MEYTNILALKKPESTDNANIADINENMDALESGIYKRRAVCSSGAATAAKTAACEGFTLAEGVLVAVEFANKNTKAGCTLNINGTGAKAVYYNGAAVDGKALPKQALLYYDGTRYNLTNPDPDAITPAQIGAAPAVHGHADTQITVTSETAQKVWPEQDKRPAAPNVDQALSKLSDPFRVGDIKTTIRTDLGNDWLLCNGDAVDAAGYPALATQIPNCFSSDKIPVGIFTEANNSACGGNRVTKRVKFKGKYCWVSHGKLFYSSTLKGEQEGSIVLPSNRTQQSSSAYFRAVDIAANDEYLVCVGCDYVEVSYVATYNAALVYLTDLTASPVLLNLSETTYSEATGIIYAENQFVLVYSGNTIPGTVAYGNNPAALTSLAVSTDGYTPLRIRHVNGKYVAPRVGVDLANASTATYFPAFYYADTPGGPWNLKELTDKSDAWTSSYVTDMVYFNGMYVAIGKTTSTNTGKAFWFCGTVNGDYTKSSLMLLNLGSAVALQEHILVACEPESGTYYGYVRLMKFENGDFKTADTKKYLKSDSESSYDSYLSGYDIDIIDGTVQIPLSGSNNSVNMGGHYFYVLKKLPTITTDGAYNYIKGR